MTDNQNRNTQAQKGELQDKKYKTEDVRQSNIFAAKAIADIMRTSLGPKGMDKLLETSKGETIITNDGATILKNLSVMHPSAKLLIQTSKAQDIEAGDGTTSVVILAGALLEAAEILLNKRIHPSLISEGFQEAQQQALQIINKVSQKVDISQDDEILQCVKTSLSSKIVSQNSQDLAPIALKAVQNICNMQNDTNVDLNDIKIYTKSGGTIDDLKLFGGVIFPNKNVKIYDSNKLENPKIALIQFCLSSPKTNVDNNIVVEDYAQIDRILKQERKYIVKMVKKIVAAGVNVLLIQKSILRDAVNDLAMHFLKKKKITVVRDIDRKMVPFICKTLDLVPVAHIDSLSSEKLSKNAISCQNIELDQGGKVFHIDVRNSPTSSILIRGTSDLVRAETDRSMHDALCVIRSLVKNKGIVGGGGAIEIEIWRQLEEYAQTVKGVKSLVIQEYAKAFEIIPFTLAQNCGINPVNIVTEMRNKHLNKFHFCGIKAKNGQLVDNTLEHKIMQPALVNISSCTLATEVVRMILKIDDVLDSR